MEKHEILCLVYLDYKLIDKCRSINNFKVISMGACCWSQRKKPNQQQLEKKGTQDQEITIIKDKIQRERQIERAGNNTSKLQAEIEKLKQNIVQCDNPKKVADYKKTLLSKMKQLKVYQTNKNVLNASDRIIDQAIQNKKVIDGLKKAKPIFQNQKQIAEEMEDIRSAYVSVQYNQLLIQQGFDSIVGEDQQNSEMQRELKEAQLKYKKNIVQQPLKTLETGHYRNEKPMDEIQRVMQKLNQ